MLRVSGVSSSHLVPEHHDHAPSQLGDIHPPESHLQACPHCDATVDITVQEPLEAITCPACTNKFSVNGQIGPYNVIEIAGKGGMGIVYRAYDPSLDRSIALKLLRKDHSEDESLIRQLESEAAITASITDPNVVRVFGTGTDRGRFYLAMELVDKGSLDDLIHLQGRVAEAQVLEVGIQIASGLRAAWQHGLIHRDVKPGNILFADPHTAKIVDFGLAVFMSQEESVRGEIWGTPYYVAPEKLDQEPEDFRADMYSLGATLFHALAGRPPFEAANATLVAMKHLKAQAVSLQAFAPWISNPTAHIINRTLAKKPSDRFQSYDELIQNFEYALEELHKHGHAHPNKARVVLETEDDQRKWTLVVLGMAVAMIALIGVFIIKTRTPDRTAVSGAPSLTVDSARVGVTTGSLEAPLNALASQDENAAALFAKVLEEGKVTEQDRPWVAMLEGTAHLVSGRTNEARRAFARVVTLAIPVTDSAKKAFLISTAAKLTTSNPIEPNELGAINQNSYEAFALFAYGLHNWATGRLDDGIATLRQFRSSNPPASFAWCQTLNPLVSSFVENLTTIKALEAKLNKATSPGERADIALAVRKLPKSAHSYGESMVAPFAKEIEEYLAAANLPPTDGVYQVLNKRSGLILDVDRFDRGNGTQLTQSANNRGANQTWVLKRLPDGSYQFRAVQGRNVLDVAKSNLNGGGLIQMWEPNTSDAQRWLIEFSGDGYFKIRSKVSNLLLTVKEQSTKEGAKLEQRSDANDPSQLWRFQRDGDCIEGDWFALGLGSSNVTKKVDFRDGTYSVSNRGKDIWGSNDDCTFLSRACGDFDFVARLVDIRGSHQPKAGLMIRPSLHEDQPCISLVSASGRIVAQRRTSPKSPTNALASPSNAKPANSQPIWLKMERRGDKISTFQSEDGKSWTNVASESLPLNSTAFVGLAVSSRDLKSTATAQFDHVTLTER